MAAINVKVLSREFVTQSRPTAYSQFELKFSGLDQINGKTHNPIIFFFENNNPSSKIQNSIKSQQLKESLFHTLTKFYPFAGKMNGDSSVICNGTGALYLVAEVDATLSDSVIEKHISNRIEQYFPLGRSGNMSLSEKWVPLAIQVTFFSCGGIAIGLNYSKRIADSWTFAMFLCSWASTCRRKTDHLFLPEFGLGHDMFPPLQLSRRSGVRTEETNIFPRLDCKNIVTTEETKMVMKRFIFNDQEIMSLKKLISPTQNPTRVELVSGYIWKQIIQMKKSNSKSNPKTKFIANIEVNLRRKLGELIGDSAMGNFMISSPVLSTLDTELDYVFLISEFRKAMNPFNNKEMAFDCVNYSSDLIEIMKKPEVWSCDFKNLCGYSLYDDLDFGWGKPQLICPKTISKPAVILGKEKNGDGVEAWINLSENEMEILSNKFLPFATKKEFTAKTTSSRL